MSIPCLDSPPVGMIEASASMRAVWAKNGGRLLGPHLEPGPVDSLLQGDHRGLVEAAAEVAGGGRVRQRRRPQAVEEHRVGRRASMSSKRVPPHSAL